MNKKFTKLIAAVALLVFMTPALVGWGQTRTETTVLTLDCATPAPTGSTSTSLDAAGIATFLNSAAGLSSAENKITCSNKTGDVYSGKGSGGGDIPQQCLKVGKASGDGGFTFTIPDNYDNIDVVEITCYGWKTTSSISINSGTAQTFSTAQVEATKTFELESSTRTISVSVTTSAVCITEIVLKKIDASAPSVSIPTTPINVTSAGNSGNLDITYSNMTISGADQFDVVFYDEDGTTVLSGDAVPTWVGQTFTGNSTDGYQLNYAIGAHTGTTDRVARLKVYALDDNTTEAYSDLLTITQTAKHTVNFGLDGGTFVANADFATDIVEVETGIYHLPSATKDGWNFTGWNDGTDTYAANAEYTVNADVDFTAQWSNSVTATYTITGKTTCTSSGTVPEGSSATFSSTYSTTYQLTSSNSMTLTLSGYEGKIIKSITLSMHSNNSSGSGTFSATAGTTTIASISPAAAFNSSSWYGAWSNPDWVNVTPAMTDANYLIKSGENVVITIAATVNSLFCQSFTIEYETSTDPMVSVTPASCEVDYQAHNPATETFTVSSENITSPTYSLAYCDENGTVLSANPTDWFTAILSGNTVSFTTTANTGEDRTAYFKVFATVESVPVYSGLCSVTQLHESHTYTLVTSTAQIVPGKHYIIVGKKETEDVYYAMGAQSGSIRSAVSVTMTSGTINEEAGVREFVISGDNTNKWTLYDKLNPGYLYASSDGSNNIGTRTDNSDANSQWAISFDNDTAFIVAQGTNGRNNLRFNYNNGNPRFTCYASTSSVKTKAYLYIKNDDKDYNFYSNTTLASVAIAPTETYTVHSPATLNVTSSLTNNGTGANLVIKDGGQLKTANGVRCQMEKNFTGYENYTGTGNGGYYLVATHVDAGAADFYEENPDDIDLYWFEQNSEGAEWRNAKASGIGMVGIQRTKGYLYARKTTGTVVIGRHDYGNACLATNADQNVPIYYNAGLVFTGVNLIGNPFTCDAYINRDYYRMNAAGDAIIAAASATTAIKPGEGIFVVAANSEDNKVTFTTTAPSSSAAPGEVNITLNQAQTRGAASIIDVARISFSEGNNLPKLNLLGEGTMLYIPQGNKDYAVVYSNAEGEMPVNFKAAENGSYTLSFSTENAEMDYLHLIDNMTGADIDLLQTPSYTFNARTTDYASRFRLVFSANSVNDSETGSETFAFFNGSEWVINASANATLQVVDMMGRIVLSTNGANTVSTNGMAQGVYVMRLVNGNDVKTQKIVVQ